MVAFEVPFEQEVFCIGTCSNSTVSNLIFNSGLGKIVFRVNGLTGTMGFCNITIPSELMSGTFTIYKNATLLTKDVDYTETYNGTHYIFSITYEHSTHTIQIYASNVIPDVASWLFLPLLVLATLLGLALRKN